MDGNFLWVGNVGDLERHPSCTSIPVYNKVNEYLSLLLLPSKKVMWSINNL
jgi:hypothetical protein